MAALGALACLAVAVRLPALERRPAVSGLRRFAPLADDRVRVVLVGTFVAFLGIYLPYTWFSAVYAPTTDGSGSRLALLLFVFGLAGTAGNLLAGGLADRFGPRRVIVAVTVLLGAVFAVLPMLQGAMVLAVPAAAVSGALSFAVTPPQQHVLIARTRCRFRGHLALSVRALPGDLGVGGGGSARAGPLGRGSSARSPAPSCSSRRCSPWLSSGARRRVERGTAARP